MPRVDGRSVLITGASSGIGAELARQLARRGCRLALMARRLERLAELKAECEELGAEVSIYSCDVTDKQAVQAAFQSAREQLEGIDIAILNAGIGGPTPCHRYDSERVLSIFNTNVFGLVFGLEALLPAMLERGSGAIVGVASLAGYRGLPVSTAYGASKAAVINMLEGMRIELRPRGIDVMTVCPGFVKSEMTDTNKFPMPFFWPTDRAARRIIRGIEKRRREIHFPLPLSLALGAARIFPNALWDALARSLGSPRR